MTEAKKFDAMAWVKAHAMDLAAYGGLVVCIIIFTIFPPFFGENMWSAAKLSTLMSNVIVTALLSVGAVFIYSMGCMDISVGGQVGLYATIIVMMGNMTGSLIPGIIVSLVVALFIGVVNGATGQLLHIYPIISSVVFMMVLNGLRSIIYNSLGTRNIVLSGVEYRMFRSPVLMVVVLVIEFLIVSLLFNYTKLGKNAKAIGANPTAAEQSGIHPILYRVLPYLVFGCCVVTASVFQMGYTGSASDSTGTGFEMNIMVALILGGMPLSGGMRSRVSKAVVGAFTFSLLEVGLPLIGVPNTMTFFVKAVIFIIVVLITCRKHSGTLPR